MLDVLGLVLNPYFLAQDDRIGQDISHHLNYYASQVQVDTVYGRLKAYHHVDLFKG